MNGYTKGLPSIHRRNAIETHPWTDQIGPVGRHLRRCGNPSSAVPVAPKPLPSSNFPRANASSQSPANSPPCRKKEAYELYDRSSAENFDFIKNLWMRRSACAAEIRNNACFRRCAVGGNSNSFQAPSPGFGTDWRQ